jgi:prepilin-type processing-associated H-X9-DG protein
MNKWLSADAGMANSSAHPQWLYRKEGTVDKPVLTPVFMDSVWINLDPMESDPPARNLYDPGTSNEGMPRVCVARHGGQAAAAAPKQVSPGQVLPGTINMGFVDGHGEQVKLQNLWTYSWHLGWQIPSVRPP